MKTNPHIIARRIFTDLSFRLKTEDFTDAGHELIKIIFSEKGKAEEINKKEPIPLCTTISKETIVSVKLRSQKVDTVKISAYTHKESGVFDTLFQAIKSAATKHFSEKQPVVIKKLITKNLATDQICEWTKVKIMVDEKNNKAEFRLLLSKIDGKKATEMGLDIAEVAAAGMMSDVCDTAEVHGKLKDVCSLIAKKY